MQDLSGQSEHRLACWLLLILTPGLGATRLRQLLAHFHTPEALLRLSHTELDALPKALANPLRLLKDTKARCLIEEKRQRVMHWLAQPQHHVVTWDHADYPPRLKQIPDAPPLLFVDGDVRLLMDPQVAMVGSRRPTKYGHDAAFTLARELTEQGVTVTSGLALGIDGAAHQGAVSVSGATIAVLGCGCDQVYPKSHARLMQDIRYYGGALVSEFAPGVSPKPGHFPRRNRIISGLSLAVLVVEAAYKSGSLITARLALEQDREVLALPGLVHNPASQGCHWLIRQGATLIENTAQILEVLHRPLTQCVRQQVPSVPPLEPALQTLLDHIGFELCPVDRLVGLSGLSAEQVSSQLFELEMSGLIQATDGGVIKV